MTHIPPVDTTRAPGPAAARGHSWRRDLLVLPATALAVGLALAVHALVPVEVVRSHNTVAVVVAAGLLLVAACLRHAQHLLTRLPEVRARARVTAMFGLVLMPLHLWSHTSLDTASSSPAALTAVGLGRACVALAVVVLLVRALAGPGGTLATVGAASALLLVPVVLASTAAWWPDAMPALLRGVGVLMAAVWAASAWYAARRSRSHPWAGALTPSLLLMGVTEVLVVADPRVPGPGATAALLVIAALAATAALMAHGDLRSSVRAEVRRAAQLETDLLRTRDDLALLQQQERSMSHHARGTLAGLRAAVHIWASVPTRGAAEDRDPTADLRRAALAEITSLDDTLRRHRVALAGGPVALDLVVGRAARAARSRGADVVVDVPPLVVLGQLVDLESALHDVLQASVRRAVGGRVEVTATHDRAVARISVTVRGSARARHEPSTAADAVPPHVRAAVLMQRQSGSLEHDEGAGVVHLVIPLCPPPPARRATGAVTVTHRIPRQRAAPSGQHHVAVTRAGR